MNKRKLTAFILLILIMWGIMIINTSKPSVSYEIKFAEHSVTNNAGKSYGISSALRLFATQDKNVPEPTKVWTWEDLYNENPLSEPKKVDGTKWSYYETKYFKVYFIANKDDYDKIKKLYDDFYANFASKSRLNKEKLQGHDAYIKRINFLASRLDNCYLFQIWLFGAEARKQAEYEKMEVYYSASEEDNAALALTGHLIEQLDYLKNYAERGENKQLAYWQELLPALNKYDENFLRKNFNNDAFKAIYRSLYAKNRLDEFTKTVSSENGAELLSKIFNMDKKDIEKIYSAWFKWVNETQNEWPRKFEISVEGQPQCVGHGWIMAPLCVDFRWYNGKKETLCMDNHELGHCIMNGPDQINFQQQQMCVFLEKFTDFYRPENKNRDYMFFKDGQFFDKTGKPYFSIQEMKDGLVFKYAERDYPKETAEKLEEKYISEGKRERLATLKEYCGQDMDPYPIYILSYLYYKNKNNMPALAEILQKFYKYDKDPKTNKNAMDLALKDTIGINLDQLERQIEEEVKNRHNGNK